MIKKGYVETSRGQLHYRYTEGGTGAPLIMFHMTAASSEGYEPVMKALDGVIPTIAFDTMNYGESYRTTEEPTIAFIAKGLLEGITNLGIDKFHTLGHHTGGTIQTEMAIIAPDRVLSLLINGLHYANDEENAWCLQKLALPNPINIKGTQFVWAWSRIKDNYPVELWGDSEVQAHIMHRDAVDMLRAGTNWHWAYRAVFTYDIFSALKKVTCPKFFFGGARDMAVIAYRERAAADYPDVPEYYHPEGGVYYIESHPEDAARAVLDFVRGLD